MPRVAVAFSLLALVLAATGAPGPEGAASPAAAGDTQPDPDSAESCGQCHTEIYQEWKGRAHHQAWDNPIYQAAIKEKARPQVCHACHIPDAVLKRLGRKPNTRDNLLHEGVTCVSCHKADDVIHGPWGAATDAHPTRKDAAFTEKGADALCASCHSLKIGPVLPVAKDFEAADFEAKTGKSCTTCHMPEVERHVAVSIVTGKPVGEKRKSRQHTVLGPDDAEFCGKAFAFQCRKEDGTLVVALENKAGHRVPALTLRSFAIAIRQLDAAGKELAAHAVELSSDNEIQALETRELRFDLAAGAARVAIAVDHRFEGKKVDTVLDVSIDL